MSFDDTFPPTGVLPAYEPGEDQRWSTWAAATPTEPGPRPWPGWLETSSAALDTELGVVKTGKEADVFLIERAVPGSPGCLLAAKRYRDGDHRGFHRSAAYEEGRRMRNTRDARAVARSTGARSSPGTGPRASSRH
jgi:RIO kinase 1